MLNVRGLEKEFCWSDPAGLLTLFLGEAAGSARLYVNIDSVPPGAYSAKYHSHSRQEEFFLVLSGQGTLRLDGGLRRVAQGDFFAKLPGSAHSFYNDGEQPLVILDVGTVEKEDVCHYPEEGVFLEKSAGRRRAYDQNGSRPDWSSAPNGE